jgi:hypothetical protein
MFTVRSFLVKGPLPSTYGSWIENLRYHVEVLTTPEQIEEVVARVSDLATAHAVFDLTVAQRPGKLVMLCQKARVLKRSDYAQQQRLDARDA